MLSKLDGVPVCVGIDWITVTQSDKTKADLLRELAFALAECELSRDMLGRPWRVSGYEGFIVGELAYGERHDGVLLQMSSVLSSAHWQRAADLASNITRLDLQATFRLNVDVGAAIRRHHGEVLRKRRMMKRPPQVRFMLQNGTVPTLYCGSPQSAKNGRIYDKGSQSGHASFQNCARYEVVLRHELASVVADRLRRIVAQASRIGRDALSFFHSRGCSTRRLYDRLSVSASTDGLRLPVGLSDIERKAQWLEKGVRPSAMIIRERLGLTEARRLLGLT